MRQETACMICESKIAEHQCVECGKMVCDGHFNHRTNMCADCVGGLM
jgi:hypothetical protein